MLDTHWGGVGALDPRAPLGLPHSHQACIHGMKHQLGQPQLVKVDRWRDFPEIAFLWSLPSKSVFLRGRASGRLSLIGVVLTGVLRGPDHRNVVSVRCRVSVHIPAGLRRAEHGSVEGVRWPKPVLRVGERVITVARGVRKEGQTKKECFCH